MSDPVAAPTFTISGPAGASWREQTLARVGELRALAVWLRAHSEQRDDLGDYFERAVVAHLDAAEQAATEHASTRSGLTGAAVERVTSNLDAVECHLLRLAPVAYMRGSMPSALAHVRRHLEQEDPRRLQVERLAAVAPAEAWDPSAKEAVIAAVHAASSKARREVRQVRSFRNTLLAIASALAVAAVAMGVIGVVDSSVLPLCFAPGDTVVCPTGERAITGQAGGAPEPGAATQTATTASQAETSRVMQQTTSPWDIAVVELLGLIAAAVAAAVALRNITGTAMPYSLPIALAVVKLPLGALTALLGLLLMRGDFIPGLSALDSSAQILAWAVVFGYAQQLLSQFVDRQGASVLDNVRGGGTAPATSPAGTPAAGTPRSSN